jgi:hypothetical protein
MKQRSMWQMYVVVCGLILSAGVPALADAPPAAVSAFQAYVGRVDARLARQHASATEFIVGAETPAVKDKLQRGEFVTEKLTPDVEIPGALLHDWRGTAFVPGATAASFERLLRNFAEYPKIYAPQVLSAKVTNERGDNLQAMMRVQQKHVITVVMDTSYDVAFTRPDPKHGYSISRSTHVAEIASPGTSSEHALSANDEHGFLWKLNTYWTYEERDGGLYIQIESVTLTRSIPHGLGWAVKPFVESVPRESLEFTLRATSKALRR